MDLGDIYLTTTFFSNFTPRLRKISFEEFWEVRCVVESIGLCCNLFAHCVIAIFSFSLKVVVRCSLVAFQDKKSLTSEIKIKGLFLSIWRHIQSSAADHMNGYGTIAGGGFNTYKGALLRGTQLLNEKFVAAWTKDNYCDYLAPLVAVSGTCPFVCYPCITSLIFLQYDCICSRVPLELPVQRSLLSIRLLLCR